MRTSQELYKYHVANVQRVTYALDRIAPTIRAAIASEDDKTLAAFLPLYMLLLGAWAECRLRKLLFEPNAFDNADRIRVEQRPKHLEKWQKVVEIAFRKHYAIPNASLEQALPFTAGARCTEINRLLNSDLRPVIEIRNKLAHGQWECVLNNSGDDVSGDLLKAIKNENLLTLQFKKLLLGTVLDVVHDLVVSKATFERDFDTRYRHIRETSRNLETRKYSEYAQALVEKRKRGLMKRQP
jgi:hypothetical protein